MLIAFAVGQGALAQAQITSLADDIILLSKGVDAQTTARDDSRLGGRSGSALGPSPGDGKSRLLASQPRGPAVIAPLPTAGPDVLSAISSEGQPVRPFERLPMSPPQQPPPPPAPVYGQLEIPETEDEGPANGLTLDSAIDRLVQWNIDLRTKAFEIPKARADLLTAGLRANPLVFATASSIPYGSYSPQRPGENGYSATVIYPLDVSHKRLARTDVFGHAEHVLEAQYQDAVRMEIDRLYTVYVNLVAARETLRYALASHAGLDTMVKITERQLQNQLVAPVDLERVLMQRDLAELGIEQARLAVREAQQNLAAMLNWPLGEAHLLEPRATLRDRAVVASRDQLCDTALRSRPDLIAYRLGVQRAQADVRLTEAEKYTDLFVLYSPYELRNNAPTGGQNATSWSFAVFGSIPLFNQNQGNIRRAQVNVTQTEAELVGLERQIVAEVERGFAEYAASRAAVERLERTILPRARRLRDSMANLMKQGQASAVDYLSAQKDYNDVVRQYRDALIRHRRSMLRLNTVLGSRVMP
jgi:cobalt-zinc-cadmium efflux system outer membrane protein